MNSSTLNFSTTELDLGLKSQLGKLGVEKTRVAILGPKPLQDFSTMNSSTPNFSTMDLGLKTPPIKLQVEMYELQTFQLPTFQLQASTFDISNLGLKTSWLKRLGLKSPELNLGVEMSCNFFFS